MNLEEFERVADSFATFHREFAPLFGRTEARARSEQYLRGLLVQQTNRRNAENLAEAIAGATPRALQRFLTEATWSDQAVTSRLQAYVGRRLGGALQVYIVDDTGFAKQGRKSVGVARQYSGTLGKVANCQVGVFLAWASEQGHTLVDKALYLPANGHKIASGVGLRVSRKRSAIAAKPSWRWTCCARLGKAALAC